MFSQNYDKIDNKIREILRSTTLPDILETKDILEKSKYKRASLKELASLLEVGKQQETDEQFALIRNHIYSEFRKKTNTLRYIAPVYLSSYCVNTCGYCNYSAIRTDVQRTRLSLPDLDEELQEVLAIGNRVIEFTLATDPLFTPQKLSEYITKTRELLNQEKGSGILLCSGYLSKGDYEFLKEAGLWAMVQWDETLDKDRYKKWHGNSIRKSGFEKRIDNHDMAIQAGLQVATGCLFGLADYRYDVLMQIAKARYLKKEYHTSPFVFGTPRLKSIAGKTLHTNNEVNDRQYELALMVYKVAEPKIARWLQTRETPELNLRNIVDQDIYTYQCGEVKPGGYKVNKAKLDSCKNSQFSVNEMTRKEFEEELSKRSFKGDYAWNTLSSKPHLHQHPHHSS